VKLNATKDACYLIRVGGWSNLEVPQDAAFGLSELSIGVLCELVSAVVSPAPAAPPHDLRKNRYLSIKPNTNTGAVKLHVRRTFPKECALPLAIAGKICNVDADCPGDATVGRCGAKDLGWVGNPNAEGQSQVLPDSAKPAARVWTETVVHIGDCEIHAVPPLVGNTEGVCAGGATPGASCVAPIDTCPDLAAPNSGTCVPRPAEYEVRATEDNVAFSSPGLLVTTVGRPSPKGWGDTVGFFTGTVWTAPNGVGNANDFVAALQKFQNLASAPHITVANVQAVSSTDPCLNQFGNIADVFLLIGAFQGKKYPFYQCSVSGAVCDTLGATCPSAGGTCVMPASAKCPVCQYP
jgi:hypothetical protein